MNYKFRKQCFIVSTISRTIKIKAIRIGIVKYVGTLKPIMPNYTSEWLRDPSPFKLGARIFPNYFTIDLASTLRLIRCFVTEIDPVVKPWESSPLQTTGYPPLIGYLLLLPFTAIISNLIVLYSEYFLRDLLRYSHSQFRQYKIIWYLNAILN